MATIYDVTLATGRRDTFIAMVHTLSKDTFEKDDYNSALDLLWSWKEFCTKSLHNIAIELRDCDRCNLWAVADLTQRKNNIEKAFNQICSNAEFLSAYYHYVVLPAKGLSPTADLEEDYK